MRAKLLEWGIKDATIVNSTGLNNEILGDNIYPGSKKDEENKLSAYDVSIVARNLIRKYPQVLDITKKPWRNDYNIYKLHVRRNASLSWRFRWTQNRYN